MAFLNYVSLLHFQDKFVKEGKPVLWERMAKLHLQEKLRMNS